MEIILFLSVEVFNAFEDVSPAFIILFLRVEVSYAFEDASPAFPKSNDQGSFNLSSCYLLALFSQFSSNSAPLVLTRAPKKSYDIIQDSRDLTKGKITQKTIALL